MFHAKRARRDGAEDHRINNSPPAQSALARPTKQLLRNSWPRRSAVKRWSKAGRGAGVRPRSLLLAITLAVAFNVVLTSTASSAAQVASGRSLRDIVRLELQPTSAVIAVGAQVVYRAKGVFLDGYRIDVTRYTAFSITPDRPCTKVRTRGGLKVSCTTAGSFSVGGALARVPFFADTAELEVVTGPVPPQIWSVEPDSSSPNKEVVVGGTTAPAIRRACSP